MIVRDAHNGDWTGPRPFAATNAALAERLRLRRPLMAVHRGTGLGSIPENTTGAVIAAQREGADIVEIDIVRSLDGEYFVFHEGYERAHFGTSTRLGERTAAEIRNLRYTWFSLPTGIPELDRGRVPVTSLVELLDADPTGMLNIDHSWRYWPELFEVFDAHAHPGRILLKCPPEHEHLGALAAHAVPYPLFVRVTELEQIERSLRYDDLNIVGFELIAPTDSAPLASRAVVDDLHERGYLVFVNALSLGPALTQFAGWDDETSVLGDPDEGWGRLIEHGADIVQTDWPGLFRDYRDGRA